MVRKNDYWKSAGEAINTSLKGASLTFKHLKKALKNKRRGTESPAEEAYFQHQEGIFTLKYPTEQLPTPDHGRYKLHNEIEDCIVCDKCAKICPVDCIDIEAIKSTEPIGETSDGTTKRLYAAKFDIDMAKCCFCGLCTTVCPTECLTMTDEHDFSMFEINEMNFPFSEMTAEEVTEKQELYETQQREKKEAALKAKAKDTVIPKPPSIRRPSIVKKSDTAKDDDGIKGEGTSKPKAVRPSFRPKVKSEIKRPPQSDSDNNSSNNE